jgi:hypothetical protein
MTLSPIFEMTIVGPEDVESLASLHVEALSPDPGNTYWWPPELSVFKTWAIKRSRSKLDDPTTRFFQIKVRETGELIAYSRWSLPAGMTGLGPGSGQDATSAIEEKAADDETTRDSNPPEGGVPSPEDRAKRVVRGIKCPEGANKEAFEDFYMKVLTTQFRHGAEKKLCVLSRSIRSLTGTN